MQKKYKCFLFDLDGTLLDTAPEFLTCLNKLLKKNKKSQFLMILSETESLMV